MPHVRGFVRTAAYSVRLACLAACGLGAITKPAHAQCEIEHHVLPTDATNGTFGGIVGIDLPHVAVIDSYGDTTYMYRVTDDGLVLGARLPYPLAAGNPESIAMADGLTVIGARQAPEPPFANVPQFGQGAVIIYRFLEGEWTFDSVLYAPDGDEVDFFGGSVAVQGDLLVVGANNDEDAGQFTGSAYVFRHVGASWLLEKKLTAPRPDTHDSFGGEVALHNGRIAVGCGGCDDAAFNSGAVFLYSGEDWALEAVLTASDANGSEQFGVRIAMAPDLTLVSAPNENGQVGAVYVFRFNGIDWLEEAKLVASDPAGPFPTFGSSLDLSRDGNTVFVGAFFDDVSGSKSGAAHVFVHDASGWREVIKLAASDGQAGNQFGSSVALDGDVGVIGAPGHDVVGAAYLIRGLAFADCNSNGEPDSCDLFAGTSDDVNRNGVPDECETLADLNQDGAVDVDDLITLLTRWGPCVIGCPLACEGDLDGDCQVGLDDLVILLSSWSEPP